MKVTILYYLLVLLTITHVLGGRPKSGGKGRQKGKGNEKVHDNKCMKNLNRIRVQRKFDMDKFLGTWYTVSRTTDVYKDNTYRSGSIVFHKDNDDTYSYYLTGKLKGACVPVVTGSVDVTKRGGHVVLKDKNVATDHPLMIISYTDYKKMALVAYCFRYEKGRKNQCAKDSMQVEVLTRMENPKEKDVKDYLKRAEKRVCVTAGDMKRTYPGQCKIPDILEAAKQTDVVEDELEEEEEGEEEMREGRSKRRRNACRHKRRRGRGKRCRKKSSQKEKEEKNKDKEDGEDNEDENEEAADEDEEEIPMHPCGVNNMPVQKDFELNKMEGLWYEIARTRYTFNKLESVVAYHRYNNVTNKITSHYTGTVTSPDTGESTCVPAISGTSKTAKGAVHVGDMVGRIGDENSVYPWSPMKVLYADDDFIMFYACYSGESNDECNRESKEVTLVGRSRDIDDVTRDTLYDILPKICIDKKDMIDTENIVNCSAWVSVEATKKIKPEDCLVDNIPVHEDFLKTDIYSKWYLSAYISFHGDRTMSKVAMERTPGHAFETLRSYITAQTNGTCTSFGSSSRDRCVDDADLITTPLEDYDGGFVMSKIMYLGDKMLIEYTCTRTQFDGTCARDGILFSVYTKNQTLEEEDGEIITSLASAACLDPAHLVYETEWCEDPTHVEQEVYETGCDVDNLDIFSDLDYSPELLYGTWYEVSRSSGDNTLAGVDAAVAFFTSDTNETLKIYYTGYPDPDNSTCTDVGVVSLISRCQTDCNGDYLMRKEKENGTVVLVPFKVIYTDYTNMLLTYVCLNVTMEGKCSDDGAQIRMWSRNMTMSYDDHSYLLDLVFWLCVDPEQEGFMMTDLQRSTESCSDNVEKYINDHGLNYVSEEVEHTDDPSQQRDQVEPELSDIDLLLQMDDEEFYSDR